MGTKRCLAVPNDSEADFTELFQWTCSNGTEQLWRLEPVAGGNGDRYQVRNSNSQKCLAMPNNNVADRTVAIQMTCASAIGERVWIHDSIGRLWNLNSNKCLTVLASDPAPGAKVVQYPCGTNTDQRWTWS
ncbi:RICIN domain-containing protein [Streptomyces sp. SID12501]|uniref:RICIN domain-containing protein n=1 Tax=Streptomyces sp. SID12501 TaxID=2706042 RepID=UPI0031BB7E95